MRLIRNSASQTSGHKGGDAMRQAPRHFVTWVALSAAIEREYVSVLEPDVGNSLAVEHSVKGLVKSALV